MTPKTNMNTTNKTAVEDIKNEALNVYAEVVFSNTANGKEKALEYLEQALTQAQQQGFKKGCEAGAREAYKLVETLL